MVDFDKSIKKSFTVDFCQLLEYHLSKAFQYAQKNKFELIWCDGVEVPDFSNQQMDDFSKTREMITSAWLGATGQDKYRMMIKLGNKSLERFMNGLSLVECLPSINSLDWVDLDVKNRRIVLSLK